MDYDEIAGRLRILCKSIRIVDYDEIAAQLNEELSGNIEHCHYGDGPCILWSNPNTPANIRYNDNNVYYVRLDFGNLTKADIKADLLGCSMVHEI